MNDVRPKVYLFGWPSFLGGADTKLAHLVILLHQHIDLTVVPNQRQHAKSKAWTKFLKKHGVRYALLEALPKRLEGFALAMSNQCFFPHRIANRVKERGLTVIWSSEMMWHHAGELDAIKQGVVDKVLYTSELQKSYLAKGYGDLPSAITGNYIDPSFFPFAVRRNPIFTIGRLSRASPEKFPEDFPVFYECLDIPEVRFRIMAWDDKLQKKFRWHRFDSRWELLKAEAEDQVQFLHSLDLFVYPLGHTFIESWGRSTVEAMLTGAIPLVPPGHHLDQLIVSGETGFICSDFKEYQETANELFHDFQLRQRLARACHEHAAQHLCNAEEHLKIWMEVFQ